MCRLYCVLSPLLGPLAAPAVQVRYHHPVCHARPRCTRSHQVCAGQDRKCISTSNKLDYCKFPSSSSWYLLIALRMAASHTGHAGRGLPRGNREARAQWCRASTGDGRIPTTPAKSAPHLAAVISYIRCVAGTHWPTANDRPHNKALCTRLLLHGRDGTYSEHLISST